MVLAQDIIDVLPLVEDLGIAALLLVTLIVIAWSLVQVAKQWRAVAMARIEVDKTDRQQRREQEANEAARRLALEQKRNDTEVAQRDTLRRLNQTIDTIGAVMTQQTELMRNVPSRADFDAVTQQMRSGMQKRSEKLDLMHADIQTVPRETARLFDPHVERLSGEIGAVPGAVWAGSPLDVLIPQVQELLKPGEVASAQILDELRQLKRRDDAEQTRRQAYEERMTERLSVVISAVHELQLQREGRGSGSDSDGASESEQAREIAGDGEA